MEHLFNEIPGLHIKTYPGGDQTIKMVEGIITLPAWKSFHLRLGDHGTVHSTEAPDGTVTISAGDFAGTVEPWITIGQVNAYHYLMAHQEVIRDRILEALLPAYNSLREEFHRDDDPAHPAVDDVEAFKNMIVLTTVHRLEVTKDGIGYVGYEFECTWDEEHGLGIMTHQDRVIEVGQAETAFTEWMDEEDLDPEKTAAEADRIQDAHQTKIKKPWWKFW